MVSTSLALGTLEAIGLLCVTTPLAIVLPDGALTTETEVDRPAVNALKRVGLNLVMLPNEVLHLLQDVVITKLQACEQRAL